MAVTIVEQPRFSILPGTAPSRPAAAGVRVLAGAATEGLIAGARITGKSGAFTCFETDEWSGGVAQLEIADAGKLEDATVRAYREMIAVAGSRSLVRIWNYVPEINHIAPGQLENYRAFCRGRAHAFEEAFGVGFERRLPAASAVGTSDRLLTLLFLATDAPVRHVENPAQIPAYRYPPEHGPKSPSFARATVVGAGQGTRCFISGTAAIRGHASIPTPDTGGQLECTLENLSLIARACGVASLLGSGRGGAGHFKVYLRHPADLPIVQARLEAQLFRADDVVTYLHADICRRELTIEIEATLPL